VVKIARKSGWNPPAQGTRKRAKMPRSAFLDPKGRRYPFKERREGKYVATERGLMAAYRRAAQQGDKNIARKALKKLNPMRKKKGKEPFG